MESPTWPGLMAECGLTSGGDKGDWRKKKKNTDPPPKINFTYSGQRMQSKQNSWTWASFRLNEPGDEGKASPPTQRPTSVFSRGAT